MVVQNGSPASPLPTPITGIITPANIVKGQATTIILGEKCMSRDHLWFRTADDDDGWLTGWDNDAIRWGYFQPSPDYSSPEWVKEGEGCEPGGQGDAFYGTFGSAHPNASNYAMCDGSVRQISYNVSLQVFEWLSTRDPRRARTDDYNLQKMPIPVDGSDY